MPGAQPPQNVDWGKGQPAVRRPGSPRPGSPNEDTRLMRAIKLGTGEGGEPVAYVDVETTEHPASNASKLGWVTIPTVLVQILVVLGYGRTSEALPELLTMANVTVMCALLVAIPGIGFDKPKSGFSRLCLVATAALCFGAIVCDVIAFWPLIGTDG